MARAKKPSIKGPVGPPPRAKPVAPGVVLPHGRRWAHGVLKDLNNLARNSDGSFNRKLKAFQVLKAKGVLLKDGKLGPAATRDIKDPKSDESEHSEPEPASKLKSKPKKEDRVKTRSKRVSSVEPTPDPRPNIHSAPEIFDARELSLISRVRIQNVMKMLEAQQNLLLGERHDLLASATDNLQNVIVALKEVIGVLPSNAKGVLGTCGSQLTTPSTARPKRTIQVDDVSATRRRWSKRVKGKSRAIEEPGSSPSVEESDNSDDEARRRVLGWKNRLSKTPPRGWVPPPAPRRR